MLYKSKCAGPGRAIFAAVRTADTDSRGSHRPAASKRGTTIKSTTERRKVSLQAFLSEKGIFVLCLLLPTMTAIGVYIFLEVMGS
jgi:hypothetical protein